MFKTICFTMLLASILSIVQVTPQKEAFDIFVDFGEDKQINSPFEYPFENVYSKQITQYDWFGKEYDLSNFCQQVPADIVFNKTYSTILNFTQQKNFKTNDIKHKKVLDTKLFNNKAYILFQDNNLIVTDLKQNYQSQKLSLPSNITNMQDGNFLQIKGQLILVSQNAVLNILRNTTINIFGYQSVINFQSASSLFQQYFAISGSNFGVVIYSLNKNILKKQVVLDATFFNRSSINISNIAFYTNTSQMFVSDTLFGINIIKLTRYSDKLNPQLVKKGYKGQKCGLLQFSEGNIYASCDQFFKISYALNQKGITNIPTPKFKIQDLLIYKKLMIAVGNGIVLKYYNNKMIPDYQTYQRLIFYGNNSYLLIKQYQLHIGTFNIKAPTIVCRFGKHKNISALLKIQAQCSNDYFEKYSIKPRQGINSDETCLYSTPINLYFPAFDDGKTNYLKMTLIALLIFSFAIFVILFIYKTIKKRLNKINQQNSISVKTSEQQLPEYNDIVEQKQQSGSL